MSLLQFKTFGARDRSGHLAWRDGDVHEHLVEDYKPPREHILDGLTYKNHPDSYISDEDFLDQGSHIRGLDDAHRRAARDYKLASDDTNMPLRHGHDPVTGKIHLEQTQHNRWGGGGPFGMLGHSLDLHDPQGFKQRVGRIQHLTSVPLRHDLVGYRGYASTFRGMKEGDEFTDHGFTGTSFRKKYANDFANHLYFDHEKLGRGYRHGAHFTIARIHMPPGTMGHFMDHPDHKGTINESEFTLHRGSRFRVEGHSLAHTRSHNYHVTHLRVIGQHPAEFA